MILGADMFFYRWRLNRIAIFIILSEQTGGWGGGGGSSRLLSLSLVPQESDESSPRGEGGVLGGGPGHTFFARVCPFTTDNLFQQFVTRGFTFFSLLHAGFGC